MIEKITQEVYIIFRAEYREMKEYMMAPRTGKQKDSQDAYMEKLQDIKVRVPKKYYDKIKLCLEKDSPE